MGLWLSGGATLWLLTALLFMAMSSLSLVFGNGVAVAMGSAAGQTGVASSLLRVMQYLFGGVVGVLLGVLHDGTLLPPLLMLAVCALAALLDR